MKLKTEKLSAVTQNVILGSVTGIVVGNTLRLIYIRLGGVELVWILFFLLGPVIGFLSGKERTRLERLKTEKLNLEKNMDKIRDALNTSTKKYRLLVERANDAIFLTSENGRFLLFNQATCLISGFNANELKNMSLYQLELRKDSENAMQKAWLDNGICRYEESWKNKDGGTVFVDVSAKWIQFSNYRLILYIARDMQKKMESNIKDTAKNIQHYQRNKAAEITSIHHSYNKHVLNLLSNTIRKIHDLRKNRPELFRHFSDLLSEWERTHKNLEMLSLKNSRDLNTSSTQWDLNDIIMQELHCLEFMTSSNEFIARTTLDPKIPMVHGTGQNFSLILGIIFQSILNAMKGFSQKEMSIYTRSLNDNIIIDIRTNQPIPFEESMIKVVNPSIIPSNHVTAEQLHKEFSICHAFMELFGMKLDISHQENDKSIIKITIPIMGTGKNMNKEISMDHSKKPVMY